MGFCLYNNAALAARAAQQYVEKKQHLDRLRFVSCRSPRRRTFRHDQHGDFVTPPGMASDRTSTPENFIIGMSSHNPDTLRHASAIPIAAMTCFSTTNSSWSSKCFLTSLSMASACLASKNVDARQ